jgi:hypothetical protein
MIYFEEWCYFEYVNGYFGFLKLGCGLAGPKSDSEVPDNIMIKYGHCIVL